MLLIHNINSATITDLDLKIKAFWDLNKLVILSNNSEQWNDEDLKGKSFAQWKSMTYFYLLALLQLIYNDINHTQQEWSYYQEKYDLENIKKCLHCIGINLDKNLNIFGFPIICENGIECLDIESSLEVEPEDLDEEEIITVDLAALLATPVYCINTLTNCN